MREERGIFGKLMKVGEIEVEDFRYRTRARCTFTNMEEPPKVQEQSHFPDDSAFAIRGCGHHIMRILVLNLGGPDKLTL